MFIKIEFFVYATYMQQFWKNKNSLEINWFFKEFYLGEIKIASFGIKTKQKRNK